ncbi:MAG: hypothetical protein V1736_08055 [Pseudomonadota bacterium]
MKVEESNILMTSVRNLSEKSETRSEMHAWADRPQESELLGYQVDIRQSMESCVETAEFNADVVEIESRLKHEITLERLLAEILSGRKVKLLDVSEHRGDEAIASEEYACVEGTDAQQEGWGFQFNWNETVSEEEHVEFVAAGVIRTADKQEIEFSLRLDMSRQFISQSSLNIRAGDALKDPLVVNFEGSAAELTNLQFSFDLDMDGIDEDLPALGPGSGFLFVDLNGDKTANNGAELFGPRTGKGFAELSQYDADGNSWIDENDPVYERLFLWMMDDQGVSSSPTLEDRQVGAIYLGSLASKFDIKNNTNQLMARLRNTSVFLTEEGAPGTIQQLDLAV